ncbi:HNH endonuclease [Bacillus sp. UNC322MFChir4.1]|uniref:HNH endonuclease n=1 Tax=Bacillus sp. UNC322MFChir4.1 TaxID=1449045 RepID=UPI0005597119|nr:HNH endonuclease [Bacillus sp. UNC322MFChir4.1]
MPSKPLRPCSHHRCSNLTKERYCDDHKHLVKQQYEKDRGSAAQRGYGARWRKARAYFLSHNPICVRCGDIATIVDHIIPHKGNYQLFWDKKNWQPLCVSCHSRKTVQEDGGFGR